MDQRADDAVDFYRNEVGHRSATHGPFRRLLRAAIHFLSYHLILSRKTTQVTRAAGFRLTVRPTVFHPSWFISSECFAEFIDRLDLRGKRVVDIGTGSGILALAAARAGAEYVVAADVNPNAALSAADNARERLRRYKRRVCKPALGIRSLPPIRRHSLEPTETCG